MPYTLHEICQYIDSDFALHGEQSPLIATLNSPLGADESSLVFISPDRTDKHELLKQTKAKAVLCDRSLYEENRHLSKSFIVVSDPKYCFAKIGNALFIKKIKPSIHKTAIIHPDAKIADNVSIGPYTTIGKCELGEGTIIHGHCYLYDNVVLKNNVTIHAGCVLGADGCGHLAREDGSYEPFPHLGRVVVESNVVIGAHSAIAKGALCDTVIKQGTIIDSYVQVGHNVVIDENVLILSSVVIAGSSHIKRQAIIAIGAKVCDYMTVGEKAHIGPGVIVMQSVPDGAKLISRLPVTMPQLEKVIT